NSACLVKSRVTASTEPNTLSFRIVNLLPRSSAEYRFGVLLTEILLNIFIRNPLDRPAAGPRPSICLRIVHRHLVLQRTEIRPGETLRQVQGFRVGKSSISK